MRLEACTVQRHNGDFCDAPSANDMPFPICQRHANKLFEHMANTRGDAIQIVREFFAHRDSEADTAAEEAARERSKASQSQVYYIQIYDHIKIGYTSNMTMRLTALRVPEAAVLATEPGGRELEQRRHKQFKHLRIGRREDFLPRQDLLDHLEAVRAEHGEPLITSWVGTGGRTMEAHRVQLAT